MKVNIRQAKMRLSKLLEKARMGEEVLITKSGTPAAKLVPVHQTSGHRLLGSAKGMFWMSDDFDAPLPVKMEKCFWK